MSYTVHAFYKAAADVSAIVGGAVVAFFQIAGPIISGVSGLVAIAWGGFSLYYLIKSKRAPKK